MRWCLVIVLALTAFPALADEPPTGATSIGGHWFVKRDGDKPVYFFRDGDQFVDLFSYHMRDSNEDGIDEVRVSHKPGFLVIESQGYPNHPTALFPNSGNPNSIRVQEFTFRLPLEPRVAKEITRLPMGPIGTALNGVVFFNPFEQGGMNAVEGYSEVWLDSCCGHPQQTGVYHYHKYPTCVKSPFADDGTRHSPIIGFAFDGFPIHGPYEADGVMARDLDGERALDVCNGHADPDRGYHYHVTPERFPYVLGGYRGTPEPSNNRGIARAGSGGGGFGRHVHRIGWVRVRSSSAAGSPGANRLISAAAASAVASIVACAATAAASAHCNSTPCSASAPMIAPS
jgi:hypothetical protein